jgi:hypothetical protein
MATCHNNRLPGHRRLRYCTHVVPVTEHDKDKGRRQLPAPAPCLRQLPAFASSQAHKEHAARAPASHLPDDACTPQPPLGPSGPPLPPPPHLLPPPTSSPPPTPTSLPHTHAPQHHRARGGSADYHGRVRRVQRRDHHRGWPVAAGDAVGVHHLQPETVRGAGQEPSDGALRVLANVHFFVAAGGDR